MPKCYTDSHTNGHVHADRNCDADCHIYANRNGYSYSYSYGHIHAYANRDSNGDCIAEGYAHATASAYTAASSLALSGIKGTRENELASFPSKVDRLLPWPAGAFAKAAEGDGELVAEGAGISGGKAASVYATR